MHHLPSRYIPCDGRLTASTYFKSTLPVGGATPGSLRGTSQSGISIHAPRRGSDGKCALKSRASTISIHAPRRGSDGKCALKSRASTISIHAPRRGSDPPFLEAILHYERFQSTLPAGGATRRMPKRCIRYRFQSTLPAGGATRACRACLCIDLISIHAPRRGSDDAIPYPWIYHGDFNPRSPQGERLPTAIWPSL